MAPNRKRPAAMRLLEIENGGVPLEQLLAHYYATEKRQTAVARKLGITQTQLRRYEEWLAENVGIKVEHVVTVVDPDGQPVR